MSFALVLFAACRSSETVTNQGTVVTNIVPPSPTATATTGPTSNGANDNASQIGDGEAAKQVLPELLEAKRAFLRALFSGDRKTVAALLADDFKITKLDGVVVNKEQYLGELRPLEGLETFLIPEARIKSLEGDVAVMTCLVQARIKGKDYGEQFTDTFVRKEGRWLFQAVESKLVNSR